MAVSVSMGVMKPLLEKLSMLMGDEYKNLKELRKEVAFLKCELSNMNALLEKMDDTDKLDPQGKIWRKDIIEMSYNIEDYIDDFMNRFGEVDNNVGILQKASHYLRTFKDRILLAHKFHEIKTLVIEAGERRKRYKLDHCIVPSTTHVIIDPRLSALYHKSENLVGIDNQKQEIVRWVLDEEQQLKVMSIVGFGGLGKTTLANEVSREVGHKFNCKALVSISQNPDIIKLLNGLTLQLDLEPYSHACDLQDLINNIRKHLQDKRYFIIVDDLWDMRTWNTLSCAFPPNNRCSRVTITTRIENVARASCGNHGFIHYMNPLSEQDSRKLFFDRLCVPEDGCPTKFTELARKILKKCGGLPLAIVTVASMIACQPTRSKGQWADYIHNFLGVEMATNPTYEDMIRIIDFSYKNLPHHLKACFLYLGTYPEDHKISRVELVRRWVAEGFISCSGGHDVWDVAESYFNELVNRSMIQPAYEDYDHTGIVVTHCRVHDMMLELILRKFREDNFINLIDDPKMMTEVQGKVIRRLTVHLGRSGKSGVTVTANMGHLSRVRSLNIFKQNCEILNIEGFKFMRLLFLHIPYPENTIDLSGINHLSQLRYLQVVGGGGKKILLPAQISGLRFLETLDFSDMSDFCSMPEVVDVPRLSHVSVPHDKRVRLPEWIGKVKSLLTLRGFNLRVSSLESIIGLGELTALSELSLGCEDLGNKMPLSTQMLADLITCVEKLSNLRNLELRGGFTVFRGDAMLGPSFSKIQRLDLIVLIFSSVPRWISHLCCLRELILGVKQICQEDFNVIGSKLTSLLFLFLEISCALTERIVIGGSTGFKVLKWFLFDCDGVSYLTFETGAMPDLQELSLEVDPGVMPDLRQDKAIPVGLQNLPSLKTIRVCVAISSIHRSKIDDEKQDLMRNMYKEAANALPTRPKIWGSPVVRRQESMT